MLDDPADDDTDDSDTEQAPQKIQIMESVSQSVSLVLSKLRIRYKNDHKSRLAADTGLTLLSHI